MRFSEIAVLTALSVTQGAFIPVGRRAAITAVDRLVDLLLRRQPRYQRLAWDAEKGNVHAIGSTRSRIAVSHAFVERKASVPALLDKDFRLFAALAQRARIVFDLGAKIGLTAILARIADTEKKVVVADTDPRALSSATQHLIYNGGSIVSVLSSFRRRQAWKLVQCWAYKTAPAGNIYASNFSRIAHSSLIEVNTITADELCTVHGRPDLIKIDVEGAEYRVLRGSGHCALQLATRSLVEVHQNPHISMINSLSQILRWCEITGHAPWLLLEGTRLTSPTQVASSRIHLLVQPARLPFPEWL